MKNLIEQAVKKVLNVPLKYHYICFGGSCVGDLVDKWGSTPEAHCGNTGDGTDTERGGGWINAPACKRGCNRIVKGTFEITNEERLFNYGVKALEKALLESLPQSKGAVANEPPTAAATPLSKGGKFAGCSGDLD